MSYETMRFGWQKLLINQVPQKGGGGGSVPDYQNQWTQAQNAFNRGEKVVAEVAATYGQISSNPAAAPGIVTANNAKLNAEISNLNGVINQVSGLPEYVFTGSSISKSEAVRILSSSRNNLQACIADVPKPPPPPAPPIPPPPPVIIKPVEEQVPSTSPLKARMPGDRRGGLYVPTGNIDGVGTYVQGTLPKVGQAVIVYAQNGKTYSSPASVPLGLQWSYRPWRWQPDNIQPPPPPPPRPVPPPPSEVQVIQQEINRQTAQLQKINRILNKPIDPAIPEEIYPTTSWQYEFWNKGYSLHEISYAEDQAAKKKLLETTKGDFALFKVKIEDLLQDAILGNVIPKPISQEIVPLPEVGVSLGEEYIIVTRDPINVQMPYQPPAPPPVQQPIRCPVPVPVVDLPQPYFDDRGISINPRLIPRSVRRRRVFQPRTVLFQQPSLNDLPGIRTCGTTTLPKKDNWEDCVVGAGASVAELDSIRRLMTQSKLAPNADICEVAKGMLAKVRNNTSPTTQPTNVNPVNTIPGVVRCGVSPVRMAQASAIAKVREQQARRGAIFNRNRK